MVICFEGIFISEELGSWFFYREEQEFHVIDMEGVYTTKESHVSEGQFIICCGELEHIMHLYEQHPPDWSKNKKTLEFIDKLRKAGVKVLAFLNNENAGGAF